MKQHGTVVGMVLLLFIAALTKIEANPMKKQDILIEKLEIYNNAGSIFIDDWILINATYRRNGRMAFRIELSLDNQRVKTKEISSGADTSETLSYHWKATAGQHRIVARAVPHNPFMEGPEHNNVRTLTIMVVQQWPEAAVAQLPDLVPVSLAWKALDNQNQTVSLEVTVKNQGNKEYDGRKSDVEITVQNPQNQDQKSTAWATLNTRLKPGEQTVVKQTFMNMVGNHHVSIHVDSHKTVREQNEGNNKLTKLNYIIPAVWPSARR